MMDSWPNICCMLPGECPRAGNSGDKINFRSVLARAALGGAFYRSLGVSPVVAHLGGWSVKGVNPCIYYCY